MFEIVHHVRPLETPDEIEVYLRLATRSFIPGATDDELAQAVPNWLRDFRNAPDFDPAQMRGAFDDDTFLGGYTIHERHIRIGGASVLTGCIDSLVTHPSYRQRGVATDFMRDATQFGLSRGHGLNLLHAIPNFYLRFGFRRVLDEVEQFIDIQDILALEPGTDQVRPAQLADAGAMLALYRQHFDTLTGSFSRTVDQQSHYLRTHMASMSPVVATSASGHLSGYLIFPESGDRTCGAEVVANTWSAACALLRYHASINMDLSLTTSGLRWCLPLDSLTYYLVADHVPLRTEVQCTPNSGWMARIIDRAQLLSALLPVWRERRRQWRNDWIGSITLAVDNDPIVLTVGHNDVRLDAPTTGAGGDNEIRLSSEVLIPLIFGYRSIHWAINQPLQHIPASLTPVLNALFPAGRAWIPDTDRF